MIPPVLGRLEAMNRNIAEVLGITAKKQKTQTSTFQSLGLFFVDSGWMGIPRGSGSGMKNQMVMGFNGKL